MALLIDAGGLFQGVPRDRARVQGPILADDWIAIAKDQMRLFELLTGRNANGGAGASSINSGHKHTESWNRLYWPNMHQAFGDESAGSSALGTFQVPLSIEDGSPATENLLHFPVFIPPGWADWTHYVMVRCKEKPDLTMTAEDSSLAVDNGQENLEFFRADQQWDGYGVDYDIGSPPSRELRWIAPFIPSTDNDFSGILIKARLATMLPFRQITSITVFPRTPRGVLGQMNAGVKPASRTTSLVQVGDPLSSPANDFHEIDEILIALDDSLDAAVTLLAQNDAFLQELLRGIGASGSNGSLAIPNNTTPGGLSAKRGHMHSHRVPTNCAFSTGESLAYSVGAWCFGRLNPISDIYGNGASAPAPKDNTYREFARGRLRLHEHYDDGTTGGASNLYLTVFTEHSSTPNALDMKMSLGGSVLSHTIAAGVGPRFDSYTFGPFNYTSGGNNTLIMELRQATKASADSALVGATAYFKP